MSRIFFGRPGSGIFHGPVDASGGAGRTPTKGAKVNKILLTLLERVFPFCHITTGRGLDGTLNYILRDRAQPGVGTVNILIDAAFLSTPNIGVLRRGAFSERQGQRVGPINETRYALMDLLKGTGIGGMLCRDDEYSLKLSEAWLIKRLQEIVEEKGR